ncbi:Eukaryotic translation initiation factor 4B [Taenia solium]|eukprot:TsM_000554600 transcript=TsM_000554600 gene=TsM_000554600
MGKKGKKNRFNQVLDIDISYSSNSVLDGAATIPSDLNLSKEKVTELQRIKAQLPSAPQAVRLEEDIARIPDTGPFRLVLVNVAFSATRREIEEFFLPIRPLYIRTVEEDGQFRGYCFVDFASKADLVAAMEKNNSFLLNRRVTMRIADQNDTGNRRGYGNRDGFNSRRPDYRSRGFDAACEGGADSSGWTRRSVRPAPPSLGATGPLPERPIIRLQPRTKPVDGNEDDVAMSARHAAIFGAAKPVDTAAIERQLEEKMAKASLQTEKPQTTVKEPAPPATVQQEPRTEEKPRQQPPRQNAWSKPLVTSRN